MHLRPTQVINHLLLVTLQCPKYYAFNCTALHIEHHYTLNNTSNCTTLYTPRHLTLSTTSYCTIPHTTLYFTLHCIALYLTTRLFRYLILFSLHFSSNLIYFVTIKLQWIVFEKFIFIKIAQLYKNVEILSIRKT